MADIATTYVLEDFIAAFNRFEAEENLFELRDGQGFPWWDLVRYRVQFALCAQRDIYGDQKVAPSSKTVRARSFLRQAWRLVCDIGTLCLLRRDRIRCLVVSSRALDHVETTLDAEMGRGRAALVVNKLGHYANPHIAIAGQSVAFFSRLYARVCRVPSEVEKDIRRLAHLIGKHFHSDVDFFALMTSKYREHLAAQQAWSFILSRTRAADRVIYVNDDTLKTLVFLARRRGIATEEVQHAYMGKSHNAFSYPPLKNVLESLPDKVIIDRDTGDITYPVQKVIMQRSAKSATLEARDIDVLIAASPSRQDETIGVVAALLDKGLRLVVKLHPAQTLKSSGLGAHFSPEKLAIHSGDEEFCALASRARVFVPVNATSTTTFEAVENGARLVVVDFGGVKTTSMNDGIVSARAGSLETLPDIVIAQLNIDHTNAISKKGAHRET